MLRDGPWVETPFRVDRQTVSVPTPDDFKNRIKTPTIEVIPLAKDEKKEHQHGWCTYTDVFDSPECEVICGGINGKTPTAAAIWRQGHLLHFGFDLVPPDMNERARQLLLNSIVYITRFAEDRPITDAPERPLSRRGGDTHIKKPSPDDLYIKWYFGPEMGKKAMADWPAFQQWYQQHRDYLRAERTREGALILDEEAMTFGVPPSKPAFLPAAVAALKEGGTKAELAGKLLQRYVNSGPDKADADAWAKWLNENQPYLFFSEAGWYQWYLDPLAKSRKTPTEGLRGMKRASK